MKHFQDKIIWIIGATDGIGEAIIKNLDKNSNCTFILSSRSADKLDFLASSLNNISHSIVIDVSDYESFDRGTKQALSYKPDCIIYLPAYYEPSLITDITLTDLHKTIQTNLTAVFYLIRFILPYLKENTHCQFAVTASVAGYIGLPKSQPYAATKAGVINLVESLKSENNNLDIKLINPSFVKTKLTDKNDFDMPMIITPDSAANEIIKGLGTKVFEIHFNKKFTRILKIISILPYRLYFKLSKKIK